MKVGNTLIHVHGEEKVFDRKRSTFVGNGRPTFVSLGLLTEEGQTVNCLSESLSRERIF